MPYTQAGAFGAFSGQRYASFAGKPAYTLGSSTSAVLYFAARALSGIWGATGVESGESNLLAWLPHSRQPVGWVVVNGQRLPVEIDAQAWYRFFDLVANVKLGGPNGATIPSLTSTVETTIETATAASTQTAALTTQAQANAESLAATVQSAQAAALPGAAQIPPVRMTSSMDP